MAKTASKKSVKKPGKAPKAKKAAAVKTKPKGTRGRKPSYKVGDTVEFKGYSDKQDKPLFEPGDLLSIVTKEEDEGPIRFGCVLLENKEAYEADPESVDGDELVAAEIKKPSARAVKAAVPDVPIKDIGKMKKYLKENDGDLAATARGLLEDISRNYFYFGGLLAHIRKDKLYSTQYDYKDEKTGFADFCNGELGIGERKARYWEDIYQSFSKVDGFSESMLDGLGWTKAAEVARYVTTDNAEELIGKAESTPLPELKETLKEEYTTEGSTSSGRASTRQSKTIKRISFEYRLFEDQAEGVKLAIEAACKKFGKDANEMFEHIVMEWAADHLTENQAKAVVRAVKSKTRQLKKAGIEIPERQAA